ncbi:hypothetical protein BH20BAC1_BH20BAC1_23400 [soil metagenome]
MKKIFYILIFTAVCNVQGISQTNNPFSRDVNQKTVKFYPNPAISFINFEFLHVYDESYSFQIYNFIGKKIAELKPSDKKVILPLTQFYRGVYIFQLKDRAGNIVESGKFQVSR